MNKQLHNSLIAAIRERVPKGKNMAGYLAETLSLGKESVYRRLRGEIYFTFEEISILSIKLGFSVDTIIGTKQNENALFNIHMLQDLNPLEIYMTKMLAYGRMFREQSERDSKARVFLSVNTLPYYFHIRYENLSRLRLYKWLHQNQRIGTNDKFADFQLSEEISQTHKIFAEDIRTVKDVTIIMDNNIFWSAAKDIEYFMKRGLVSEDEVQVLQRELLAIVDRLEAVSNGGLCDYGIKTNLYVSSVDLEASYLSFESNDFQFAQVRVFSISAIDSHHERLCRIQREWIESLKKYSVLISQSGEMQRFEYLNRQRGYINKIPNLDP